MKSTEERTKKLSNRFKGIKKNPLRRNSKCSCRMANFDVVVLAATAGGIKALSQVLSTLPADLPVPVAIVQDRTTKLPYLLARVLGKQTRLKVKTAVEGEHMHAGPVCIASPDKHFLINKDHTLALSDGPRIRHGLSSANPLFASATHTFNNGVIAVVLSGGDTDGTNGVQSEKAAGGVVIAQDEATSEHFDMPKSAIDTGCVDYVLSVNQIGPKLLHFVRSGYTKR